MDILAQYARTQKCDHCGGCHNTEICAGISPAGISPAPRKRCAACHRGEHTSWSTEYLARGGGKGGGEECQGAPLRLKTVKAWRKSLKEFKAARPTCWGADAENSTQSRRFCRLSQ